MEKSRVKPKYNVWQNSLFVIRYTWGKDKVVLFVILVLIVLAVAIQVVTIFLPRTVVAQIIGDTGLGMLVGTILGFTVGITALQAVFGYLDSGKKIRRMVLRLGVHRDNLEKVIGTDYSNLEEQNFSDLSRKAQEVAAGNAAAAEQIYFSLERLGTNIFGFVVFIVLLAAINPLIMVIIAVTSVFGVLARRKANKWRFEHDNEEALANKRMAYVNNVGNDHILAKDIRLFSMVGWLKEVYDANVRLAFAFTRKAQTKQLLADIVDCAASFIREGVAYAYLIWQVLFNYMPVDEFVLMFAAIGGFSVWVAGILNEYGTLSELSLRYCRLREFMDYPDKFKYDEGAPIAPEPGKTYELELKNVTFKYPGAPENTLENINLTIKAGEKLAVVGLNGAGKTTLIKLICGFYDPAEGQILLNGQDIRKYNRKQYYTMFTAVFQEFNILPLSIAENISMEVEEDADHSKIEKCLKLADLFDKIESLPDKTSSLLIKDVNETAVELSGGETQKLMLARALYKDAPILILDEPTSALDPIAESKLYNHYNELSAGKTSIYISHRLASTRFCDRIILVDNKSLAEIGTHEELLAKGGKYAELYEIQSKYYKDGGESSGE